MLPGRTLQVVLLNIVQASICSGFLEELIGRRGRTGNCGLWSAWGECLNQADYESFMSLPPACTRNRILRRHLERYFDTVEEMSLAVGRRNESASVCGSCHYRFSCSHSCAASIDGNRAGIASAPCSRDPGTAVACQLSLADNACEIWPPKEGEAPLWEASIQSLPSRVKVWLKERRPLNCVKRDGACHCCCAPERPDPGLGPPGVVLCTRTRESPDSAHDLSPQFSDD